MILSLCFQNFEQFRKGASLNPFIPKLVELELEVKTDSASVMPHHLYINDVMYVRNSVTYCYII